MIYGSQERISMFIRKCDICGAEFQTCSNRAKYCVLCRDKAQVIRNRKYAEKKKAGISIAVGSEQICPVCRKPYLVTSGSQKCCKDCARKRQNERKTPTTAEYLKRHYDYIRVNVPKGKRDDIKKYAQSQGMSVNKLFLTALEEYRKKHK